MPSSFSQNSRRFVHSFAAIVGVAACLAPFAAGCSDPPPLIPRGAWYVAFTDPPTCGPGAENALVGIVTADARNELLDDGVDGTNVSCSVIDNGGSFGLQLSQSAKSKTLTISVGKLSPDATEDNPSKGTVVFFTPQTADSFTSSDCDFYFIDGTGQGVKSGEVWAAFKCAEIASGIDNICSIDIGYFAFENCETE